ncbi:hypothetical protein ACFQ51_43240 [Streptomyces kaempferi]
MRARLGRRPGTRRRLPHQAPRGVRRRHHRRRNYTPDKSARVLRAGWADAIAFGRLFIANPDLPRRLADGSPLNELRLEVISGGDATGYTDYPSLTG